MIFLIHTSKKIKKLLLKLYISHARRLPLQIRHILDRGIMRLGTFIPISQIPKKCLERINHQVSAFSVPLFIDTMEHGHPVSKLIGSGTLIEIGDQIGVLTADHVSERIGAEDQLGLILTQGAQHYAKPSQTLKIATIGQFDPSHEYGGPDMSVIFLPREFKHEIAVYKSFYPIDCSIDNVDVFIESRNETPWIIWGTIDAETKEEEPESGFERVKGAYSYSFICGLDRYFDKDDFDYVDISVDYASPGYVPLNFGGISGGGIWSVKLAADDSGNIVPEDLQLMGVAYYQTEIIGDFREIRGHGLKSIVKGLCNL